MLAQGNLPLFVDSSLTTQIGTCDITVSVFGSQADVTAAVGHSNTDTCALLTQTISLEVIAARPHYVTIAKPVTAWFGDGGTTQADTQADADTATAVEVICGETLISAAFAVVACTANGERTATQLRGGVSATLQFAHVSDDGGDAMDVDG